MMFMTPMPPTTRLTAATQRRRSASAPRMPCVASRNSACELTLKSSRPGSSRWRSRKMLSIWLFARFIVCSLVALTMSWSARPGEVCMTRARKLPMGIITRSS